MSIKVRGFGSLVSSNDLKPGMYFTAHSYRWTALCIAVDSGIGDPTCVVLAYEGDFGDPVPAPQLRNISVVGGRISTVDSSQLTIQPCYAEKSRPFMVRSGDIQHGSLIILPTGEPVIAVRQAGRADYSLSTGKSVDMTGGLAYAEWEITFDQPALTSTPLARFPAEEG